MKRSFVKNAGILAISVIIAKVLGAIYRVPLTSLLGAEGMGLYQFVYPVFALLLTLSSGAVPNAISISVSERLANGDEEGAKRIFSVAMKLCVIIGTAGSVLLAALAYPISLLQSKDAFFGHLSIAPAILIVTLVSGFRGWFMGHNNMVPSSISQITEGTVKLAVGLTLTWILLPYGKSVAVVGALSGVVASELVTLLIMAITFFIKDKTFVKVNLKEEKGSLKKLKSLIVPLVACGMILPVSQFVDSLLIANLLRFSGVENAVAEYGLWSGVVTPLINLPVMICITLGIAVTPQMVEGREKHDVDYVMDKANVANKLTFLLGIPFVFLYIFMANGFIGTLFPRLEEESVRLSVELLRISAGSVLGLSVFQIYSAMLQGLGRAKVPVKIMGTCMIVKLLLTLLLVPLIGIRGSAVASLIGYTASGVWITVYFANFVRLDKEYIKNVSLISLCGVIMSTLIFTLGSVQTSVLAVICVGVSALLVYFLAVLALNVFSREELKSLPLSGLWLKLNDKMKGETG